MNTSLPKSGSDVLRDGRPPGRIPSLRKRAGSKSKTEPALYARAGPRAGARAGLTANRCTGSGKY